MTINAPMTMNEVQENIENHAVEMLRKEFEAKFLVQKHESEIKELKQEHLLEKKELERKHEKEIETLKQEKKTLEEWIKELEGDVKDYEGELKGIEEEAEQKREKPFGEILLGRALMQAGENILKNNPKLLKIGLGITDEEIKKIWEADTKKIENGKTTDNSGFCEIETEKELAGLESKHAQGIKELIQFFKQIKAEEFRKLFTIDCMLQDPKTGMLNNELTDKVLQFIDKNKPEEGK